MPDIAALIQNDPNNFVICATQLLRSRVKRCTFMRFS